MDKPVSLDIIVPMYNEETVVVKLMENLEAVFSKSNLAGHNIRHIRYIMIDDGSTDRTPHLIARRIENGFPALLCRLSRNFGQQAAILCGLNQTDADVICVIDADLQDPPEEILKMLHKWRKGADVVYAVRTKRKEIFYKRMGYYIFYRLLHFLSEGQVPLDSGDFSLMSRKVVETLRTLPEHLRFERGLRAWIGFRQEKHIYERRDRAGGSSKYNVKRLYHLATSGIANSSIRPLKIAQVFAVLYLCLSFFLVALLIIDLCLEQLRFFERENLFILVFLAFGNFATLFCLYILSAYIGRGYLEIKGRPAYIIKEITGDAHGPNDRI